MLKNLLLGIGATLMFVSAAHAVDLSPPPAAASQVSARTQTTTDTRRAMVVRDEWGGGYRAPISGDRGIGVASLADFMAAHQTEADFERVLEGNDSVCRETGAYIRESIAIMGEADKIDADLVSLATELTDLGKAQNRASWFRRGLNVISGALLCGLSSGGYCGAAIASTLGSEVSSSAHDRAMRHNRGASEVNNRQSRLQLRATLLTMRMNIGWSRMIHGYCLQYHPDATLGTATAAG